jgi:phosphohistidine phosphatase
MTKIDRCGAGMNRLILLRHGKAESESQSGDDFDRRLTGRGERESAAAGAHLANLGLKPDLALVSTAARARGTWAAAQPAFPSAEARFEDDLYHAGSDTIRQAAEQAGGDVGTVMVVGHNPGMQDLVVRLLMEGHAPPSLISQAQRRFPTAAAAVFLFDDAGRPAFDGLFFPERGG